MHINLRTIIIVCFILFFATAGAWFGFERVMLYARIHSPITKPWVAVHLSSGELFYGHLGGMASGIVELRNVRFLEKFTKTTGADGTSGPEGNQNSQNFSLGAGNLQPTDERYVVSGKSSSLFIPLNSLLYFEEVDPASEVYRYLR